MGRLKGSTLIESLAALTIIAVVIGFALYFVVAIHGPSRNHLKFEVENRVEQLLQEAQSDTSYLYEEVLYTLESAPLGGAGLVKKEAKAYLGERLLNERYAYQLVRP